MYEAYFRLKERPFSISPDPRFIYLTTQHQEALAKCQYAIVNRMGISTIYGDIGAGKTSLARRLWEQYAADNKYNFAMLVHPNYPTPFQLLKEIRREFGVYKSLRSLADELNDFRSFLIEEYKKDKTTVLVLDEGQNLKPPLLELLRQLLNFETNTEKLLQIVLFGQNELGLRLDKKPELKDRVTIFGALTNLTKSDADALIDFRWKVAGGDHHPFKPEALEAIFVYSRGLPRKICKLCDNALIRAFSLNVREIGNDIIDNVAQEVRLTQEIKPYKPQKKPHKVN